MVFVVLYIGFCMLLFVCYFLCISFCIPPFCPRVSIKVLQIMLRTSWGITLFILSETVSNNTSAGAAQKQTDWSMAVVYEIIQGSKWGEEFNGTLNLLLQVPTPPTPPFRLAEDLEVEPNGPLSPALRCDVSLLYCYKHRPFPWEGRGDAFLLLLLLKPPRPQLWPYVGGTELK